MVRTKVPEFKPLTFKLGYKTLHVTCEVCGSAMRRTQSGWCCDGPRLCGRLVNYAAVADAENRGLKKEFTSGLAKT